LIPGGKAEGVVRGRGIQVETGRDALLNFQNDGQKILELYKGWHDRYDFLPQKRYLKQY